MTVSLALATVTSTLAALTVNNSVYSAALGNQPLISIRDITGTQDQYLDRDLPVLAPVNQFVTGMTIKYVSLGAGAGAQKDITYVLHYRYFHALAGSGRGYYEILPAALNNMLNLLDSIIATDLISGTRVVDIHPTGLSEVITVKDATNNTYYGADLALTITEQIN